MMIKRNNNRIHQSMQGFNRVGYLPDANPVEMGNVSLSGCEPGDNLNGIFSISKKKRQKQMMALALAVVGGLGVGYLLWKKKKK